MSIRSQETQVLVDRLSSEKNIIIGFSAKATQQLNVNNGSVLANSLAHLLCNKANHPIVEGYINGDELPEIPKEFDTLGYGLGNFFYMCGSAPRFVSQSGKHLSQDALRALTVNDTGLKFYFWAQEYRIKRYGGDVGLPQSVKEGRVPKMSHEVVSLIMKFRDNVKR
ncbi:MAG: hypothetical protein LM513_02075, partial [Nitrospira sp.]|nr:hypothetical protein [Nitrospira sp.]